MRRWWVWAVAAVVVATAAGVVVATAQRRAVPSPTWAAPSPPASPAPSEPASPAPSRTPVDRTSCVAAAVARLSPVERAGQLLMIGTPV
ncbi:MAG TPA: hypothetical protein VH502_00240, partial [Actinoplanes sp.]